MRLAILFGILLIGIACAQAKPTKKKLFKGGRIFFSKVACEHKNLKISCRKNRVLHVYFARYGRSNGKTCPSKFMKTTKCSAKSSMTTVRRTCNGKRSCRVSAKNSVFGDPCVGTYKYLTVVYGCRRKRRRRVKRKIICEGKTTQISCKKNRVLRVYFARYGRSNGKTCPSKSMKTTKCSAKSSMKTVRHACNGRRSCKVSAKNSVFGDPCVGTYKYLTVVYGCRRKRRRRVQRKTICEGKTTQISCKKNRALRVYFARYGRSNGKTCPSKFMKTTKCSAKSSIKTVRHACNGRRKCKVSANNSVFGDPCVGTYKYLTVVYGCRRKRRWTKRKIICEGKTTQISCKKNRVLRVYFARYGRSNGKTCPSKFMKTTKCSAKSSMTTVRRTCNGKRSCKVSAKNSVFGDPCVGTYKYLTVVYGCRRKRRWTKRKIICEGKTTQISCKKNRVLRVYFARYGRSNGKTCPSKSMKTTKCSAKSSMKTVRHACNGKRSCKVSAKNSVFGDPCVGTYKYLTVVYGCRRKCPRNARFRRGACRCKKGYWRRRGSRNCHRRRVARSTTKGKWCRPPFNFGKKCRRQHNSSRTQRERRRKVVIQHKGLQISCKKNRVIRVRQARFGRGRGKICSSKRIKTARFYARSSMKFVRKACNGKRSCKVSAKNLVFRNPCGGTRRKLTVVYSCRSKAKKGWKARP